MATDTETDVSISDIAVDVWYCETVEKVRVASEPGGDALSVEEAKAFDEALETAIERAEVNLGHDDYPSH